MPRARLSEDFDSIKDMYPFDQPPPLQFIIPNLPTPPPIHVPLLPNGIPNLPPPPNWIPNTTTPTNTTIQSLFLPPPPFM